MLPVLFFPLVTLAAGSVIDASTYYNGKPLLQRDDLMVAPVTEKDVRNFDLYAEYALASYCNYDTDAGAPVVCQGGCPTVQSDGAIVVQGFEGPQTKIAAYVAVVNSRKQIVVSIRGTSNAKNWLTNLNFFGKDSDLVPGGVIHGGFNDAWKELSTGVLSAVKKAKAEHPKYSIIATGHSLGGAVATIATAYLRKAGHTVDLYSYGAPRIGNAALSDFITNQAGKEHRITHGRDPVPRVPPSAGTPYKYRHVSPEYWLTGKPADPNNWPISDIKICEGNNNSNCNGSSLRIRIKDHLNYLGSTDCKPKTGAPSRMQPMTDEDAAELDQMLSEWVQMDAGEDEEEASEKGQQ